MKKLLILISIVFVISLCACGSKPQPVPTAAPTDAPTGVPAEPAAENTQEEETSAVTEEEAIPETYDPSKAGSVLRYYETHGQQLFGSYAYLQLDTEGKNIWAAPLAGIKEFRVPETFREAKGGIRASGGKEIWDGKGIVCISFLYLPFTEAEYDAFLDRIAAFQKEHPDPTDEDKLAYSEMVNEYNQKAYILFDVYGIGENGTVENLKNALKENYVKSGAPEDAVDDYLNALEIIDAGSAEDYQFYISKRARSSENFTETQAEYKEEYDALYDAFDTYVSYFTFMRPLALAELVAEGTGFVFETKDLNGNAVSSAELFSGKKGTMVNIWQTTCSACMSEMPELNRLADEFAAKGGQIVGLVFDATEDDLIAEAKEIAGDLELNFVNLIPTHEMKDFFKAQAFPTTYFFNEMGEVIGEPVMGVATDLYAERMNELLGD